MKNERIFNAIGYLDGDLVSEAAVCKGNRARTLLVRWGALAACLAVLVMAAVMILPALSSGGSVSVGGIDRDYKINISATERGLEYPWEYKTVYERFSEIRFGGVIYDSRANAIREDLLSEVLGTCTGEGYDIYTDKTYTDVFEVRGIKGVSSERLVAVGMEGAYYVYLNRSEEAPVTLGELFSIYGLEELLPLERFSVYENGKKKGYYLARKDAEIMGLLAECVDAPALSDADAFGTAGRDYISFTATSESLGLYKKVFTVTADGYLSTNIFDYRYVYDIGEETARRIISAAKSGAKKTENEPYEYRLAGTLTEIGDGYILIDDTVLCKDPKDGLVFKVLADDIRIRRCYETGHASVGDLVVVSFRGSVDPEGYIISGATDLYEGVLIEGDVLVQE